ncbi:MAG TPA: glycosyltransferase family 1 protein [Gemmatimonadales bacterium]|nr:glycosyltransferase family 1 protein [Gemmatimonadales bacterium]
MTPAGPADPVELVVNVRHLAGVRTGIEIYMEELLGALASTGQVRITALTWAPLHLELPGVQEVIPTRRPEMRAGSVRATLWKLWFDQWACLRTIPRRGGILIHGMDGFLPYAVRSRDRCVATVHDLGWQAHPELYANRVRWMYSALFPWSVRRADRFIAVSRYTADDLMRRAGVPASKIEVIYHGLDPAFHASPAGFTADDPPYLLAVGGVSPRKNTRRLIEAFTRWRSRGGHRAAHRLLITGTSLDSDFGHNGAGLPEGVSLLGYVEKAELARLYAGAAAFMYPGIYEGFGLPIIEAMACGAPVVTSSTGAAPEIAGGAALLVDPFDVASIEYGLERVTISAEADRLRSAGHERARQFQWNDAAMATVEVYRRLVA